MIPNKIIPRKNGTNIRFSKEVIRKAAEVYFKRGYQQESTLEHKQDEKLAGMTVVESWIVEDAEVPLRERCFATGVETTTPRVVVVHSRGRVGVPLGSDGGCVVVDAEFGG